jgi:hypothetical protein
VSDLFEYGWIMTVIVSPFFLARVYSISVYHFVGDEVRDQLIAAAFQEGDRRRGKSDSRRPACWSAL